MKWKHFIGNQEELEVVMGRHYTRTMKIVLGGILAALASIFQSAGIFVGFGYVISILTTLPIVIATVISIRIGFMTYISTILLLAILQPSELMVFPFTTGLIGLALGVGLRLWKSPVAIILLSGLSLTVGISILLYALKFPILGPSVISAFDPTVLLFIMLFSLVYSWIWLRLSIIGLRGLQRAVFTRQETVYKEN
ncbi:putative neutral ceramidase superfamily lipid hydrolase [Bacillus mesophilus]|uniref:DUF2232 domain-containing protein n=1 Tax=Bacillus mesophilus TaxID=1808955 RepID=A0A6M0Q7Q0_9BACI|nr:hypothetical protein [Bacillus mesophilus]MBM7660947.1 putative neutral ceramidase superfamily lipid hydrolase [Bacillus mesophilus]NEY71510.1 hypothetical protein [Bacillus mesophilus]